MEKLCLSVFHGEKTLDELYEETDIPIPELSASWLPLNTEIRNCSDPLAQYIKRM